MVAAVHGNEPSGVLAAQLVLDELERDPSGLVGEVVAVIGNRGALTAGKRYQGADLNRFFTARRVERLRSVDPQEVANEERELIELDLELRTIIDAASGSVHALDLHSTSGHGPGFLLLEDQMINRRFALNVPAVLVLGLQEELIGTVNHHLMSQGVVVCGYEAGQHEDPASVERARAAIWLALEASGAIKSASRPEVAAARSLLRQERGAQPQVVELRYRHGIKPEDNFKMLPGFKNLDPVKAGQVLGHDVRGEVRCPQDSLILMPLYQAQGQDGFFLVSPVNRMWLNVSAFLRKLHLDRWAGWLPGVVRHPSLANAWRLAGNKESKLRRGLLKLLGYPYSWREAGGWAITRRHLEPEED